MSHTPHVPCVQAGCALGRSASVGDSCVRQYRCTLYFSASDLRVACEDRTPGNGRSTIHIARGFGNLRF